jgi:AAA+ ATPase superfamily predicted ATPase
MYYPGLIIIYGRRCSGKTTLMNKLIEALNLSNVYECANEDLKDFNEIEMKKTDRRTIIMDELQTSRDFLKDISPFLFSARYHNATVIIIAQNIKQIPISIKTNAKYIFECQNAGNVYRYCYKVNGGAIIFPSQLNEYLNVNNHAY